MKMLQQPVLQPDGKQLNLRVRGFKTLPSTERPPPLQSTHNLKYTTSVICPLHLFFTVVPVNQKMSEPEVRAPSIESISYCTALHPQPQPESVHRLLQARADVVKNKERAPIPTSDSFRKQKKRSILPPWRFRARNKNINRKIK